jgi:hypothetical protein
MLARVLSLTVAVALAGCVDSGEEPLARVTQARIASLRAPVIALVGQPVTLDASATTGRDLEALSFVFELSDGTEPLRSTEPVLQHVFTHVGLYSVRLRVVDTAGHEAVAIQDVSVRADRPPPCQRASDCLVGDECDAGVCWSIGGSIE